VSEERGDGEGADAGGTNSVIVSLKVQPWAGLGLIGILYKAEEDSS
jgi:hypothetical protein